MESKLVLVCGCLPATQIGVGYPIMPMIPARCDLGRLWPACILRSAGREQIFTGRALMSSGDVWLRWSWASAVETLKRLVLKRQLEYWGLAVWLLCASPCIYWIRLGNLPPVGMIGVLPG